MWKHVARQCKMCILSQPSSVGVEAFSVLLGFRECFFLAGAGGLDSRRELRALVVRRENSSTGRVFYTAPTSSPTSIIKKKQLEINSSCLFLVRETGLEPVRWKHTPLKRARLPIPPLPRTLVLYHKRNKMSILFSKIFLFFIHIRC